MNVLLNLLENIALTNMDKVEVLFLSLKQPFHGRTLATLTATGQDKFHNYFFPFPEGFDYVIANSISDLKEKLTSDVCA